MLNRSEIISIRLETFTAALRGLISYTILVSIFLTGSGFSFPRFTVYWYYPVYGLLLIYWLLIYGRFSKKVLFVLGLILVHSVVVLVMNKGAFSLVFKQVINIFFSFCVFSFFIRHENYDVVAIFRKYVNVAKAVVIIGFVQVALFAFGAGTLFLKVFPFESNISSRLQSVTLEPSFFAYTFCPIVFVSLYNFLKGRRFFFGRIWGFMFIVAYILTVSAIAFVAVLLMLLVIYFNPITLRKVMMAAFVLALMSTMAYSIYLLVPEIRMRIDDTLYGFNKDITNKDVYLSINLSSYALLTNYYVTREAVKKSPLLGTGLGTYEHHYDLILPLPMRLYFDLNRADANSMALRLAVETGLIGLSLVLIFIYTYKVPNVGLRNPEQEIWWLLNNGILILIVLWLIRSGHYSIHGRLLFFMMYYYSYRFFNDSKKTSDFSDSVA